MAGAAIACRTASQRTENSCVRTQEAAAPIEEALANAESTSPSVRGRTHDVEVVERPTEQAPRWRVPVDADQ